jgi:asparagine N-glycosylation enzyme membrane subunit Stt3
MIWLLLILLILTLLFPSIRLFAEKYAAKVGVWIGLIDSMLLILFGVIVLPAIAKLQADFGASNSTGLNTLYISIGLVSSIGMFLLSLYSKRQLKTKELFYAIYILGLTSMLLTVWSMIAVMGSVSAGNLIQ